MRVLVEEGGADITVKDRWGNSPLDEAKRVGAALVVDYLEAAAAAAQMRTQELLLQQQQQQEEEDQDEGQAAAGAARSTVRGPTGAQGRRVGMDGGVTGAVSRQQLQRQRQEEAAAELKRQQLLQAQQVRREVKGNRINQRREAIGQLLMLADQAHQLMVVKANQIEQDFEAENQAKTGERQNLQAVDGLTGPDSLNGPDSSLAEVGAGKDPVMIAQGAAGSDQQLSEADGPGSGSSSSNGVNCSNGYSRSNNVVSAVKLQSAGKPAAAAQKRKHMG